ncbi:MAG: tellurite resistance/C4-dicarboxylate transporter family protein [Burkholderiales bacterium]|nr:tellurite resistance/C4-dicarboxylate transporter family protein [Burkholderiales bacterium]
MKWHCVINNWTKNFHPAYFAMVMATGIVSLAFDAMNFTGIARALSVLNLFFYLTLSVFLLMRMLFFLPDLIADFKIFKRSLLFLTFVIGTNTVGMQLLIFHQAVPLAILLWFVALAAWFIFGYFILCNLIALHEKFLSEIASGSTLLITVSTVSIPLLGISLLNAMNMPSGFAYLTAIGFWFMGLISYTIIISLLFYNLYLCKFDPEKWDAPYWICMGAAAIITLAGSRFVIYTPFTPTWEVLREAVLWITIVAWMIGTLWIPYLLFMDIQKFTHTGTSASAPLWVIAFPWLRLAFGRTHRAYDPVSWSRVFPMGMYTVSLVALTHATKYEFLAIISQYWGWFALCIWFLTLVGMLRALISFIRQYRF